MFWEDYYRKHPTETRRVESGELIYENTGDPLIDKWEQEIAKGLTPDLYEGLDSRIREKANQSIDNLQNQVFDIEKCLATEGFSDDYTR